MYREPLANDDVGQGHRTGKALLSEQSLRHNATVRPTQFIGATLDDNLAPVSEANTDYLGEIAPAKETLFRLGSQNGAAPPANPRGQI
jgi:hypothetical protein